MTSLMDKLDIPNFDFTQYHPHNELRKTECFRDLLEPLLDFTIEDGELGIYHKKKGISEKSDVLKENRTKDSSLSKLFKENEENQENKKKIIKPKKKDNVLLLTRKIDDNGKIVDLKKIQVSKKK